MKIDIDKLAEKLNLPTWDTWSENFIYDEAYGYAYKEAYDEIYESQIQTGVSEQEAEDEATTAAEQAGQEAEETQSNEEYENYYDNLMHVAEKVFGAHGLSLVPIEPPKPPKRGYSMEDDLDGLRKRRR